MRRFRRIDLPAQAASKLKNRNTAISNLIDSGTAVDATAKWENSRNTKYITGVLNTLQSMAGDRRRCMYCGDSHGTDIEHFWPKSRYPNKMFLWLNLLLCCTECGRIKGDQFPLKGDQPLLLDPTVDDPWMHLDFDPATGNISAKYCVATNSWDYRGEQTVETLDLDRREVLSRTLLLSYRRLTQLADDAIGTGHADLQKFLDADDTGLLEWCLFGGGVMRKPFMVLAETFGHLKIEYAEKFR